jgi:hypothetical protein
MIVIVAGPVVVVVVVAVHVHVNSLVGVIAMVRGAA